MARIRTLKPDFFTHEGLASVSAHARLAFQGLWIHADREGRLKDQPGRLRVLIFPYEPVEMADLLTELERIGVVTRYVIDGVGYLELPGFVQHQRPHPKEPASILPPRITTAKHGETRPAVISPECFPVRSVDLDPGSSDPDPGTAARRREPPLIVSPLAWDRKHAGVHLTGFCDWVCFPTDQAEQFASRAEWSLETVTEWAKAVRRSWEASKRVPTERMYDFWNARWAERHPAAAPSSSGVPGAEETRRMLAEKAARAGS